MSFPLVHWDDLPAISANQMQQLIMLATGKFGLDNRVLVEHTARNLVSLVEAFGGDGPVLVVAGRGNNGSGGLAAARLLAARGRRVWVVPTHEAENYSGTPKEQLEHLRHFERVKVRTSLPKMKFGCVIDAAIGTNLEGPPRGRTLDVITVLNNSADSCVISLDTPTGMRADDGSTPGDVVKATLTMSIGLPKVGIKAGGNVGRLFVGDLSLPPGLYESLQLPPFELPAYVTEVE
ncbi:MAG TPA: NAD(P)H-hydrate epimerase [Trueperaceae bacterium]|nr:NAD(P)H-hydrate epimerase [Trueperaceae bacterium]HRP47213.1 NAD(P)H-hydrate epimerase [Trueperaceae bacterium]